MRAAYSAALTVVLFAGCAPKQGDFTIQMPANGRAEQPAPRPAPAALEIRLTADAHGKLAGVFLNGQKLEVGGGDGDVLDVLNRRVREIVQDAAAHAPSSPEHEAVFHVDERLDYSFVIDAVAAVSTYAAPDGAAQRLATRVRFASPDGGETQSDAAPTVDAGNATGRDAHREAAN